MQHLSFFVVMILQVSLLMTACSPSRYREKRDKIAYTIIKQKQQEALGHTEEFTLESPEETLRRKLLLEHKLPYAGNSSLGIKFLKKIEHWPEKMKEEHQVPADKKSQESGFSAPIVTLSLFEALQIGASTSREYQTRKEDVFRTALNLDFKRNTFRNTFSGQVKGQHTQDQTNKGNASGIVSGAEGSATATLSRTLLNAASFTTKVGVDLVQMLQPKRLFSRAFFGDASIAIPLLRGSGRHIITEPLTQAEREMLYAIWDFELYKGDFATDIIDSYLTVLKSEDQIHNMEANYRGLIRASGRANRLADAGKTPRIQVDQAIQNELSARNRWIAALQTFDRDLDLFKIKIGLPTDASLELDRVEFQKLQKYINKSLAYLFTDYKMSPAVSPDSPIVIRKPSTKERGPLELNQTDAVHLALKNRLDLQVKQGRVYDAQRQVVVAADQLRPELSLLGSANLGQRRTLGNATLGNSSQLDFPKGNYTGLLTLDLALERTAEANAYRDSFILLERAVREVQKLEDQIKFQIRDALRNFEQARASLKIQYQAVQIAERRVKGASLNLEAGRAQIRDLLEAQEALLNAQNGLTSAMVDYRLTEIRMQRDLGILRVDNKGQWHEQFPREKADDGNT